MIATSPETPLSAVGRMVLPVGDLDVALSFYRDVLGFAVLHDRTDDGYRYLHVGLPGQEPVGVWLMPAAGRERASGGRPSLVLYTTDLGRLSRRLGEYGVRVWNEREDAESRSLHLADPDGNTLIVAELKG
ncbi:VOC family protein [Streptosporangium jomthongense]|uniref:VOC family protein n=1 Tax=Streptosporangium jomthongense TaxID=1193683 RepID=A0ABV8F199_9ACTN